MRKSISIFEAALPLLTMLVCLVGGGYFFPMGTELLVFVMFIAAPSWQLAISKTLTT